MADHSFEVNTTQALGAGMFSIVLDISSHSSLISYLSDVCFCKVIASGSGLKPGKTRKSADALKKLCNQIEESINPYDKNLEKHILVNIDTCKGASPETKKESSIKEVNERPSRFEDAIYTKQIVDICK